MWFWVWTLLALGALGAGVLTWRDVWRSGRALGRELSAAASSAGAVWETVEDRTEAARVTVRPTLLEERAVLQRSVDALRDARRARRADRLRPRPEVWARWRRVYR